MKHSTLAGSVAACICLGLSAPLLAAEPAATTVNQSSPGEQNASTSTITPAKKCLSDLRAFDSQMQKDGYWLGASGYGYGYPVGGFGYGYGYPMMAGDPAATAAGYQNARKGYEIRILVASANILARQGQQQPCEDVLATTRDVYKLYTADMRAGGVPMADVPGWRKQQIAAAQPVTNKNSSIRSDELIGTDVRNAQDVVLGSADDLVMSPKTGKIAYLVIARGGIFGIDEKYVPVPWDDFKATPGVSMLVVDTTKIAMEGAPQVNYEQFTTAGHFDRESQKVDAYWKTHLTKMGNGGSHG
jgi:sporulation protein YlmC with PRC-barrel domain